MSRIAKNPIKFTNDVECTYNEATNKDESAIHLDRELDTQKKRLVLLRV